jgi:tyrosinase
MRVCKSIDDLQIAYERGDKKPLETLMRAWKGIQDLPPADFNGSVRTRAKVV